MAECQRRRMWTEVQQRRRRRRRGKGEQQQEKKEEEERVSADPLLSRRRITEYRADPCFRKRDVSTL